jgi:transketolase
MTKFFEKEFPGRFFEMGIGKQNMISTAAGLALSGNDSYETASKGFASSGEKIIIALRKTNQNERIPK